MTGRRRLSGTYSGAGRPLSRGRPPERGAPWARGLASLSWTHSDAALLRSEGTNHWKEGCMWTPAGGN